MGGTIISGTFDKSGYSFSSTTPQRTKLDKSESFLTRLKVANFTQHTEKEVNNKRKIKRYSAADEFSDQIRDNVIHKIQV